MAATPRYGLAYPGVNDSPHGPNQVQDLAVDVEAALGTVDDYVRTGIGGEMVANAAQSLTGGGAVRLTFGAVLQPANGITWNGTNTFTITSSGVYAVYAQARKSIAAAQDALHITGTSYSDASLIIPGTSTTGYGDVHVSGTRYFAAGTVLCVWYYSGSATANSSTTRFPMFSVWKVAG